MNSNARVQAWRDRTPIEVRRAADRERYARSPAKWERHIKATYGIDAKDYATLLDEQGGCCAICRKPPDGARLCIDHDHVTNEVRGLLCSRCKLHGSIPRIRHRSVRIKPSVSRANHWGPQGRLRAAAKIETTALLMAGQGRRG